MASPSPKAIAHPFFGHFCGGRTWGRDLRRFFLGAAVPAAYVSHTEAPRKVWPHSESGGRTWPAPPPKAIAHPFFGHFYGGRTRGQDLWALILGYGSTRVLFLAHGGPSQSLAPFRVRRTNLASPSPKAIAHPFFGHFCGGRTWGRELRALIFGRGSARGLFLAHGGPSQILAPFRVRRTNLWTEPSGAYFWARQCPQPIFGTRRPLA